MNFPPLGDLSIQRRAAGRRMFCRNALLWGLGNGLVSTSLIIYVVIALCSPTMDRAQIGLAIGWIVAAPRIVGLLRLFAPAVINRFGGRRRVAFVGYLISPLLLLALPILLPTLSHWGPTHVNIALGTVGLIWAAYHVVEYFATVALWSWIGDLLEPRIRPMFLARRERAMIAGQLVGNLFAGAWTFFLSESFRAAGPPWRVYLAPTLAGIFFLVLAAFPILGAPEVAWPRSPKGTLSFRSLTAPFLSKEFLPFMIFGVWIQVVGGLGQSAQSYYQMKTLGVPMLATLALASWTRFGQMMLSGSVGRALRLFGPRRVMAVSLLLTAVGSLFYAAAEPQTCVLLAGAATFWIGWVGVNLGIAHLLIQNSPAEERSSYVAVYFTVVTLAFGLAALAGGRLFDLYRDSVFSFGLPNVSVDFFRLTFVGSWLLRSLGVVLLWTIPSSETSSSSRRA